MSISQNFPNLVPTLNLNFARSKKLDPRITFTRASTATRMNSLGLIENVSANVPRFDHSYSSSTTSINSLGLLVEDTRTNLLQRSQEPATSPWAIFNIGGTSIVNNSATAPDGTTTAGLFTCGTDQDSIYQDVGSISGTGTYTLSVFLKGGTSNYISFAGFFLYNTTPNFAQVGFNPNTGQVVSSTSGTNIQVQSYPNGWYKLSVTGTGTNALNTAIRYQIYSSPGTTYIWGAQLEQGAFLTSYIPTTNAQVTRSAESATITGTNFTNFYNSTEYTLVSLSKTFQTNSYPAVVSINDGTLNNVSSLFYDPTLIRAGAYWRNSGTQYGFTGSTLSSVNVNTKQSLAVKTNDWGFSQNGVSQSLSSGYGVVPTGVIRLSIGNGDTLLNGHISQILYYPKRLTNTQLENLTK